MFKQVVPLSSQTHIGTKLKTTIGFGFASSLHLAAVSLPEFPKTSMAMPVFFVKQGETGKFSPLALMGTTPGENLFVNADGSWQSGVYTPIAFRRYPFVLLRSDNGDELVVCIDGSPDLLDPENGEALFTADGAETEFLTKAKEFLFQAAQWELLTEKFCAKIVELDLLVPGSLEIRLGDDVQRFPGAFIIDENRLNALPEKVWLDLRAQGFVGAIYAHLLSLGHIDSVVSRKASRLSGQAAHSA
jgi:SapC